jgi:hypothetical protein
VFQCSSLTSSLYIHIYMSDGIFREEWKNKTQKGGGWPGMVVHVCNPSCSGGKGRRNRSLRPAWHS